MANIVFQDFVHGLDVERLQAIALELLLRQPAAFNDLVNGQIAPGGGQPGPHDPPPNGVPDWCKCGHWALCCLANTGGKQVLFESS